MTMAETTYLLVGIITGALAVGCVAEVVSFLTSNRKK